MVPLFQICSLERFRRNEVSPENGDFQKVLRFFKSTVARLLPWVHRLFLAGGERMMVRPPGAATLEST